jgi:PAS domain S-box-containing protein
MNQASISGLKFPSPVRTICVLLLVLFSIEILLMYALPSLLPTGSNPYLGNFADAALLAALFSPVLYHYIFRPFREIAVLQKSMSENVLAHVVDGVVLFDERLVIHSFNSAAERIFGYSAAEMMGAQVERILGGSFRNDLPVMPRGSRAGASPAEGIRECIGRRKDQSAVPVEFSQSQIRLGGRWMWLGIVRDISARKQNEEKMKHTLSLLTATLESTADGVRVRDLAGKTIIANKRFADMWQIPGHLVGTHDDRMLRDYVLEQLKEPQEFLALTEEQYVAPGQESYNLLNFKDGRVFERFSAPQVIDETIVGQVVCYRDLTEQKNLENQLRHAQKMEALGTLAGGVAHDFNNILTVIMGFCSLTSRQLDRETPLRHNLDQIMTASERALTLTNSLLAYSRKQARNPKPVELNANIRKTEKFLARLIGEEIELVTTLAGEDIVVMADSGQLEQVLMNLAANARDAMARKGCLVIGIRKLEIDGGFVRRHGYGKPGTYALISVSDTGTGMDKGTREKIFEPFFTTKQTGHGTGLGLSIVYGIVKQHDGFINVYSEPGKGTTFNIYLPVVQASEETPVRVEQRIQGGTETILLAEDDDGVRALVQIILADSGYRVIEARDGEDAVEKFRESGGAIDLLVLDVVMPKKNGKETLAEICALHPGTKAIFMSGYTADIIDKIGLVEAGLPLLNKPLLPNELLAKVREMLD